MKHGFFSGPANSGSSNNGFVLLYPQNASRVALDNSVQITEATAARLSPSDVVNVDNAVKPAFVKGPSAPGQMGFQLLYKTGDLRMPNTEQNLTEENAAQTEPTSVLSL